MLAENDEYCYRAVAVVVGESGQNNHPDRETKNTTEEGSLIFWLEPTIMITFGGSSSAPICVRSRRRRRRQRVPPLHGGALR